MEAGVGGAAVATTTTLTTTINPSSDPYSSIPGILRHASQTRDGLQALRSLLFRLHDPPDSAHLILEAAERLRRTVDAVCGLMKQLRMRKTSAPLRRADNPLRQRPDVDVPPAALAALERHMHICVDELQRVNHAFRLQLNEESTSLRQTWKQVRVALEGCLEEFLRRVAGQEAVLARQLKSIGCQVDHNTPVDWEPLKNKLDESPAERRLGNSKSSLLSAAEPPAPKRTSSTHSEDQSGGSSATPSVSGRNGRVSPNKVNAAHLSRRLGQLTLTRSTSSVSTHQVNGHPQQAYVYYYTCDALGGIDDGSEELTENGSLSCVFCGMQFVHDDEMTVYRMGAHLVKSHSFGHCNLNCIFENRDDLIHHLKSFHRWSRTNQSPALLDRMFLVRKGATEARDKNSRLLALEDGDAQPMRGLGLEREQSDMMNLIVLNDILRAAGLGIDMNTPQPNRPPPPTTTGSVAPDPGQAPMAHALCLALSQLDKLDKLPFEAPNGTSTPTTNHGSEQHSKPITPEDLMYHAACVQQELAVTNGVGDDDVCRHEALYSADQYKIDDLVISSFPLRTTIPTEKHRTWHVRAAHVDDEDDPQARERAEKVRAIPGLGIKSVAEAGPLRSFRDAVRTLGRAHMSQSGQQGYISLMPQVLSAARLVLWQHGRSSAPPPPRTPLTAASLARHAELQAQEAHLLANTTAHRRLRWTTDPSLDWWFFGMLERSASFRRLVRCGRALSQPSVPLPAHTWAHAPAPASASRSSSTTRSRRSRSESPKPAILPFAWASILLSSAGTPQHKGSTNGLAGRVANGNCVGINGNGSGSSGHFQQQLSQRPVDKERQRPTSPAVSLVRADHGSGSDTSEEELEPVDRPTLHRWSSAENGTGKESRMNSGMPDRQVAPQMPPQMPPQFRSGPPALPKNEEEGEEVIQDEDTSVEDDEDEYWDSSSSE